MLRMTAGIQKVAKLEVANAVILKAKPNNHEGKPIGKCIE